MNKYKAKYSYLALENTVLDTLYLNELLKKIKVDSKNKIIKNASINVGGWQSWNPAIEVKPEKKQASLKCHLINQWNKYLVFPESLFKPSKNLILGQFICYLRWENEYVAFVSTGNIENTLPPVQFIFNRKNNSISIEIADKGKFWTKEELQAEINIFYADSYFKLREKLESLFGSDNPRKKNYNSRFSSLDFLGKISGGYASWYSHYTNISEQIILEDLHAFSLQKDLFKDVKVKNPVFQIDDGWELSLGDWTWDKNKFPQGLDFLSQKISNEGLIPGLWFAPFIVDERSQIIKNHPHWILRDFNGKKVSAGFNPNWGSKITDNFFEFYSFYCLDLSSDEVLSYLDSVMENIINKWGFRYIKLDFLYAGMLYGDFINSGASYEFYTKALNLITKRKVNEKGESIAYLACGAPFELSYKNLPLARIGCDTFEHWENKISKFLDWNGRNSAKLNLQDTLGRAFWNNIVFKNDPDVIFLRKTNCTLSKEEKLIIGKVAILFGSQLMLSDKIDELNSFEIKELCSELMDFKKKFEKETFGVEYEGNGDYKILCKNPKYLGYISLGKIHELKIVTKSEER